MKYYYNIAINGQQAVSAGYAACSGSCYKRVCNGLAQMEVVIDMPGQFAGRLNKWVSACYIKTSGDVETVLGWLSNNGFSGCYFCVELCYMPENSCCEESEEVCNGYIV